MSANIHNLELVDVSCINLSLYDVTKTVTTESAWTCSIILKYFFRNICNRCIGWNMHSRISFVITARAALLILQGDSWILTFLIVLLLRI